MNEQAVLRIPDSLLKSITPRAHNDWKLWEKKNLNIHRGLIALRPSKVQSIHDLAKIIRNGVREEFRPNWFRGFGFGTIIWLQQVPSDFTEICQHIDTRNKKGGVWQWAVIVLEKEKVAIAIHTWLHGYLRPVYDSVVEQFAEEGYQCHASDAEMDALVAKLRTLASTCRILQHVVAIIR